MTNDELVKYTNRVIVARPHDSSFVRRPQDIERCYNLLLRLTCLATVARELTKEGTELRTHVDDIDDLIGSAIASLAIPSSDPLSR